MFQVSKETSFIMILAGVTFFFTSALLFFEKGLMIVGNLLIVFGMFSLFKASPRFFIANERLFGSFLFFLGIYMMLVNHFMIGFLVETVGLLMLIKTALPDVRTLFFNVLLKKNL